MIGQIFSKKLQFYSVIKLIKSNSKYMYIVKKRFQINAVLLNFLLIKES